jgi:hypothetical protein
LHTGSLRQGLVDSQFLSDITSDYKEAKSVQFDQFPPWMFVARSSQNPEIDKRAIRRPREEALQFAYIQYSSNQRINAIVIDIDDDTAYHIDYLKSILPLHVASIVGRYENNQFDIIKKPHIRINLSSPVYKDKPKQVLWLKSIIEAIQFEFKRHGFKKVDKCPPVMTKNPFSKAWRSYVNDIQVSYSLKELSEKLNVKRENKTSSNVVQFKPREIVRKENTNYAGRNEEVFHETRIRSYQLYGKYKTQQELYLAVLEIAKSINATFPKPLLIREVANTADSITDFVFNRYVPGRNRDYNIGAAKHYIEDDYDLKKRLQVGAFYSHKLRSSKALQTLSTAISEALSDGVEITKKGMAKKTGLDMKTIRKYWEQAQSSNTYFITDADRKLHQMRDDISLTKGGGIMPYQEEGNITTQKEEKEEKAYNKVQNPTKSGLNVISNEKNNIDVDENTYSTDENNQIIEEKEDRYDYRTYLHIVLNMNDDDDCPF